MEPSYVKGIKNSLGNSGGLFRDGLVVGGCHFCQALAVCSQVKDLDGPFLRPGVERVFGVVHFQLNDGVFFGESGVDKGRHEEAEGGRRVVDLHGLFAEPAVVSPEKK